LPGKAFQQFYVGEIVKRGRGDPFRRDRIGADGFRSGRGFPLVGRDFLAHGRRIVRHRRIIAEMRNRGVERLGEQAGGRLLLKDRSRPWLGRQELEVFFAFIVDRCKRFRLRRSGGGRQKILRRRSLLQVRSGRAGERCVQECGFLASGRGIDPGRCLMVVCGFDGSFRRGLIVGKALCRLGEGAAAGWVRKGNGIVPCRGSLLRMVVRHFGRSVGSEVHGPAEGRRSIARGSLCGQRCGCFGNVIANESLERKRRVLIPVGNDRCGGDRLENLRARRGMNGIGGRHRAIGLDGRDGPVVVMRFDRLDRCGFVSFEAFEVELRNIEDGGASRKRGGIQILAAGLSLIDREFRTARAGRAGNFFGAGGGAAALHGHGLGLGDPPGEPRAERSAERGKGQRDQDAGNHSHRRSRCRDDRVDPGRDDQPLDQARTDREAAHAEQRAEPQCDRCRKQGMAGDGLLVARFAARFSWLDPGQSSTPVVDGPASRVRNGRAALRPFDLRELPSFGKRLDNVARWSPNHDVFQHVRGPRL
jgi:hypothetical protein